MAFHNFEQGMEVNHKDKNRSNNCAENLEWVTHLENVLHSSPKDYVFFSPDGVRVEIHNLKQFCKDNGLHDGCMHAVNSGERKQHKGWKRGK